jgi:thiamine-phosphate pyrophosphorylase
MIALRAALRLYLVTDRSLCHRDFFEMVEQAVAGGVTMVQLREKELESADFFRQALKLKKALSGSGIPLIINDRLDIALAAGADGVHLGSGDLPLAAARRIAPPGFIIGASVFSEAEALEAARVGADYLAVSPLFLTPTKSDAQLAAGIAGLKQIRRATALPLVAIGGINRSNVADAIRAGADGVAVVSAIVNAEDPAAAVEELLRLVNEALLDR